MLTTPRPNLEGRDVTVVEPLDVARREVETTFANQPEVRAAVHAKLGATYSGLGRPDAALEHLREGYLLLR